MINFTQTGNIVEAIEDGKIVKVSEEYARKEGLLILRKHQVFKAEEVPQAQKASIRREEQRGSRGLSKLDEFRKTLRPKENDLIKELIDNFHWLISKKRRDRGVTRKQLAVALGETENSLKMIENGVLPANNFILVNKLESYFGINLRKNKVAESPMLKNLMPYNVENVNPADAKKTLKENVEEAKKADKKKEDEKITEISGEDIEVIEE